MTLTNQQIIDKYNGDWLYISKHQTLPESFIRKFQNKIKWKHASRYQTLSESLMREFQNKVDWYQLSVHQTLSVSFIREFQNKVDWYWILIHQTLSEEFIKEYQDKVMWDLISKYQTHINYDHLIKSLPKPKKGSLVSYRDAGHGIVLNINKNQYEVLFMESQQITSITNKYDILNLKVVG